jgi:hypothetical protein
LRKSTATALGCGSAGLDVEAEGSDAQAAAVVRAVASRTTLVKTRYRCAARKYRRRRQPAPSNRAS